MRSTGGVAAPSGNTLSGCELAATPSLCPVMDVLVGIVAAVAPGALLRREPGVETRGPEAVGTLLALRRGDREGVGVFVLGVAGVPPHPAPGHGVDARRLIQLLPQLEVLDRAGLAGPPARLPAREPLGHAPHQVLGVRDVGDLSVAPLAPDPLEHGDGAGEGHPVVGGLRGAFVEIPSRHAVTGRRLDQGGVAARAGPGAVVAKAALVGVHQHDGAGLAHGWTTTGMGTCVRSSSAFDTTTAAGPSGRSRCTWAPANRTSARSSRTSSATTSAGRPGRTCVWYDTRCSDRTASAGPTTSPAAAGSPAWRTCRALPETLANRAASSRARPLDSPPSTATAQVRIGDGAPAHTTRHRSATRTSAAAVRPSAPLEVTLRLPTRTNSASRANSASTWSASPGHSSAFPGSPPATSRNCARSARPRSTLAPGSWAYTAMTMALNRRASTTACSSATSACTL